MLEIKYSFSKHQNALNAQVMQIKHQDAFMLHEMQFKTSRSIAQSNNKCFN